mgnify:FL=1
MGYWIVLFLFCLGIGPAVRAQNKGVVKGRVFDLTSNEAIPFANVVVYGTTQGRATDEEGRFRLENVPPGLVRLEVSSIGYQTLVTVGFLLGTAGERTENIGLEPASTTLKQVVVKANPYRKTVETPVSIQRIGIAEMEKNPGGNRDISKVVQSMPGVLSSPAFRNDFVVRGGGPAENRFYLDGVELPILNHFATQGASGGVVSIVNIDFVKEVNFFSGAFPAAYGNMMSSMLEFRQIEGNPDRVKTRVTFGATDYGLSLDGPLAPKTTFIVSARRSYLKMLFGIIGLPFLPVYNDMQFKTVTRLNARNEWTLLGIGGYDINRLNTDLKNPDDHQKYLLDWLPESRQWSYTLGTTFKHYGNNWYHFFVLSRSGLYNKVEKYTGNDRHNPKTIDYRSGESENKFRFEHHRYAANGFKLQVGAGIEYAHYDNTTARRLFAAGEAIDQYYSRALNMWKWAVFGQVSRSFFSERLALSLGFRADGCNYTGKTAALYRQISPRFSFSYSFDECWSLNGNIGRYYQLPAYTTLGFADAGGVLVNKRNKTGYIGADHYVLGVEYRPGTTTRITLEGFYKTYDHYPVSLTDSVALANKGTDYVAVGDEAVRPVGQGRAYGLELMLRTQEFYGVVASLAYTWYYSEFKQLDENLQNTRRYIPSSWDNRHIFSLTATRRIGKSWDLGFKWRYVAGGPYTPYDRETSARIEAWDAKHQPYYDYSRFNTLRLPAFHQLDVRVDKSFFFRKWSLIFYADIQNIYNYKALGPDELVPVENPDGSYRKDPDREGYYQMRSIKNELGGTVLPSVGVIVDF